MSRQTNYKTMNLLVPAFGNTRCLFQKFPLAPFNILDFNGVTIDDIPFLPQAVTIDTSLLPDGQSATFSIDQIEYSRTVTSGKIETFNFPAIPNLKCRVVTSDGISTVKTYFFNYPAFVDKNGIDLVQLINSSVAVLSTPGPTATQRLQFSQNFAGTTSSGTLIATSPTERIKITAIGVNMAASAPTPTAIRFYQTGNSAATGAIMQVPINNIISSSSSYSPPVPLLLGLGNDLLFDFSVATSLNGNLSVNIDYEIV